MVHIDEATVRQLLPMNKAIDLLAGAFRDFGAGAAQSQPRRRLSLPSGAVLHQMAGAHGAYFGTKIYSTHPKHGAWFVFLLYDAETAMPLALLDANWLGQIRTGAASGLATRWLARPEAQTVAVLGSGFQAASQLEAVLAVRPIRAISVWSRSSRVELAQSPGTAPGTDPSRRADRGGRRGPGAQRSRGFAPQPRPGGLEPGDATGWRAATRERRGDHDF